MKRSQHIRLVLIGGLSTAAMGAGPPLAVGAPVPAYVTPGNVLTNDHFLPGVGYYHAPYRAWFPQRYNQFDAQRQMYFHGGQWSPQPHLSITNISQPLPSALPAPPQQSNTTRSGWGSSSRFTGS